MDHRAPELIRENRDFAPEIDWPIPKGLLAIVICGAVIRFYLCIANYCVSGDGAAYIGMAKDYAAGNWRQPLSSVFSPLYPGLIAVLHPLVHDWEFAGDLVSALMGVGGLVSVYLLMREVYGRIHVALGAAALVAIHPALAAYSASVRTEAGYILLTTTSTWLLFKATRERRILYAALCGFISGLSYLYRTEAIGFILLSIGFPVAAALLYRGLPMTKAWTLSLSISITALSLVVPYVIIVHAVTGVWTISRELTAAIMFGFGSITGDTQHWHQAAFSLKTSTISALLDHPGEYARKIGNDFVQSFYGLAQAAGPVLWILIPLGLWKRGRLLLLSAQEAFLAFVVVFYFSGFALTLTGARFISHLLPFTLGWAVIGFDEIRRRLLELTWSHRWQIQATLPAAAVALIMLPQTLWPIGYDMRGVRYAGETIARRNHDRAAVAARDGRVAWYAGVRSVQLPAPTHSRLCDWLMNTHDVGYLLLDNHDESAFGITSHTGCLEFIARYARYGSGYYDLYSVRRSANS
jgi:hypothetical protein